MFLPKLFHNLFLNRLGEMKQTPVASHNYFSNYHQYRNPTAGATNKPA